MAALLATTYEVQRALTLLKAKKAFGPDCIPNLLLKTFVFELAPVVCKLYNASLLGVTCHQSSRPPLYDPYPNKSLPSLSVET